MCVDLTKHESYTNHRVSVCSINLQLFRMVGPDKVRRIHSCRYWYRWQWKGIRIGGVHGVVAPMAPSHVWCWQHVASVQRVYLPVVWRQFAASIDLWHKSEDDAVVEITCKQIACADICCWLMLVASTISSIRYMFTRIWYSNTHMNTEKGEAKQIAVPVLNCGDVFQELSFYTIYPGRITHCVGHAWDRHRDLIYTKCWIIYKVGRVCFGITIEEFRMKTFVCCAEYVRKFNDLCVCVIWMLEI